MNHMIRSDHETFPSGGETWIRPIPHRAASRQQPDAASGVEPTHPEYNGRFLVTPAGRAFINHWKRGPYFSLFGSSGLFG